MESLEVSSEKPPEQRAVYSSRDELVKAQEQLGQLEHIKIEARDFTDAHKKLGEKVKTQAQNNLREKLKRIDPDKLATAIRFIRQCRQAMEDKIRDTSINPKIRDALKEYFDCLSAWAKGASLEDEFQRHELLKDLKVDDLSITGQDLALWLQNDNLGCQTGMLRGKNGSIIIWHTEEDDKPERVDRARLAQLKTTKNGEMNAFIYPDLMPGSTFGWNKDHLQAVDFLYLTKEEEAGTLANVVTWITLKLGNEVDPEEVVKALLPYADGYALNTIQRRGKKLVGKKIEFANDKLFPTVLGGGRGDSFIQVNIISKDAEVKELTDYQQIEEEKKEKYAKRRDRAERALHLIKATIKQTPNLDIIWRMLAFRLGSDYAYANKDVKAHWLAKINMDGRIESRLSGGPAIKKEAYMSITGEL